MARTPRIAVIGSANTDLVTFIDAFPRAGETIFGQRFDLGFGGKGANQAVAARLCGADVLMLAKVGEDLFGDATVRNFAQLGIDTTHVRVIPGVSTGAATVLVEPSGQNRIIVVKGANDRLAPADVAAAADALGSVDTIILQFEIPLETVYYTVGFARQCGIRCIVNPAPALPADLGQLSGAAYFIPNETEAETLTGLPVQSPEQAIACASALHDRGFERVVITLGSRGALLSVPEGHALVPPFSVQAIDTTGAGDAFIGSFATLLAEGLSEQAAVAGANRYAALSTTRIGTQKSFPHRAEFDAAGR
jgi:ribokinase